MNQHELTGHNTPALEAAISIRCISQALYTIHGHATDPVAASQERRSKGSPNPERNRTALQSRH